MKAFFIGGGIIVLLVLSYFFIFIPSQTTRLEERAPEQVREQAATTTQMQNTGRVPIVDTPLHPATGFVRLAQVEEKIYVRFEDFKTINGPDLFVYLATDTSASEFINLGALKATEGEFNYEIPMDTDLAKYRYALVWCRAFGVLFNSADLGLVRAP